MKKFWERNSREISVVIAIAIMFLVFGVIEPIYASANNIRDIIEQSTIYGLMGMGITGVIITGGIDLSVGSVLALVGAVVAQLTVSGIPLVLSVLAGLAFGFLLGLLKRPTGYQASFTAVHSDNGHYVRLPRPCLYSDKRLPGFGSTQ
ncbi:MAG: ABC transporter permease [Acetivibrionales bacterium]